ncbi:hypothetical protein [Flavobacterium soli]|uniref:hypothetical protein n=1 Tax=Flavobacterium soli TaxID=344881 RepID=UPI00047C68F1|nr:hypothetical protein [Flavobacterium soli]
MKKSIFILLMVTMISCRSNYKILVSHPSVADGEIHGYNLENFFENKKEIKNAKVKDFELLSKEINLIKDSLSKCTPLPYSGENFGIYKYVFVVSTDTLYSTSTFEGWRYGDKVCKYEKFSPILIEQVLKSSN